MEKETMSKEFKDQVAIVTGGASGIGKAIVAELVAGGAKVLIADFDGAAAARLADEFGENARAFAVDVADAAAVEAMVHEAETHWGGLHLAVNNAGVSGVSQPLADLPLDNWRRVIDVNLNGVFYGMKYQIPAMLRQGGGAIVNMASILGTVGFANSAAYVTAKHALLGLTRAAALEYSQQGVR